MNAMFRKASAFEAIGDWNTSAVTNMNQTFRNALPSFNRSGNWDVSAVTDMNAMFTGATSFNQPIGDWDVSAVQKMRYMFSEALPLFEGHRRTETFQVRT